MREQAQLQKVLFALFILLASCTEAPMQECSIVVSRTPTDYASIDYEATAIGHWWFGWYLNANDIVVLDNMGGDCDVCLVSGRGSVKIDWSRPDLIYAAGTIGHETATPGVYHNTRCEMTRGEGW